MPSSFISHLRLTDFRNYAAQDIDFSGRPVVLYGANGSGKTNLLEALSFLSPGRGLRRANVSNIARRTEGIQAPAWGINADLVQDEDKTRLSIGQVPEQPRRRLIKIDGQAATGTQLANFIRLIWLIPAQDRLFTGPASERRKFLDRFALAHHPDHGSNVLKYEKARSQRGRLLSDQIQDPSWYDAYETTLAETGAKIAANRVATFLKLRDEIDKSSDSAFPKAGLQLDGEAEDMCQSGLDISDIINTLKSNYSRYRDRDLRAGRTLSGVHKTDLFVTHRPKSMPASQCSTGEQKALLTGLILAQSRAVADRSPFILLDEVAAHLDIHRRAALIEELVSLGSQVFMTGTDAHLFEAFEGRADLYEVSDGKVTQRV